MRGYEVTPKERILRYAIQSAGASALPITPSAVFGIHVALVLFIVLTSVSWGFVALFYLLWLIGGLTEGFDTELIGDDSLDIPRIYWPWGGYQRRIRRARRIRSLERECGIRDPWPL